MSRLRPRKTRVTLLAAAVCAGATFLLISMPSCRQAPPPAPAENAYTVRGRIVSLPDPVDTTKSLAIQHEAIPDYRDPSGERVGMESMPMPFTPAKGLSLQGLHEGDPVEFVWEVRWAPPPFSRVSRITRLPAGTPLNFGASEH